MFVLKTGRYYCFPLMFKLMGEPSRPQERKCMKHNKNFAMNYWTARHGEIWIIYRRVLVRTVTRMSLVWGKMYFCSFFCGRVTVHGHQPQIIYSGRTTSRKSQGHRCVNREGLVWYSSPPSYYPSFCCWSQLFQIPKHQLSGETSQWGVRSPCLKEGIMSRPLAGRGSDADDESH